MKRWMLPAIAMGLAACATPSTPQESAVEQVSAVLPDGNGLPPQTLANGECGLFFWTQREPRQFVFFSKAETDRALVWLGSETLPIALRDAKGDIFGQFMTETIYLEPQSGKTVTLTLSPGELLDGGQRARDASLKMTDREGWETILPLVGLRACQLE